jgi:hypothetical protein
MSKEQAVKATRNGAYAAFIAAAFTLLLLAVALSAGATEGLLGLFNDASIFFDVLVMALCGIGMLRKSRAAAITALVYALVSRLYLTLETGEVSGIGVSLIFFYFYGKAIQGAYVFHRIERAENPDYRPSRKWAYWLGVPVGALFALLMVAGLLTMTGVLPPTVVQSGEELAGAYRTELVDIGIIDADEEIMFFYSDAAASIADAGNVLTDRRVIRYFVDEGGELVIYELFLDEIGSVRLEEPGDFLGDSVYRIASHDGEAWFQLALSTEAGGDAKFADAIRERIR